MKTVGAIFLLSGILSIFDIVICVAANTSISKDEAIRLANIEAIKLGYDVATMEVSVETNEGPFNACIGKHAEGEYIELRKTKLSDKKYYTVSFGSKPIQLGGNICLFIDRNSGEIITDYRGR